MIPKESGWLVRGKLDVVAEGLSGTHHGSHHVVLMACGRDVEAVKVHIGRRLRDLRRPAVRWIEQ